MIKQKVSSLPIQFPLPYPQTPESAREIIWSHGVTIADICRAYDIPQMSMSNALRGRTTGRGKNAHRAHVLLGLKPPPGPILPVAEKAA
jgi:gp16 family phage-associated protein